MGNNYLKQALEKLTMGAKAKLSGKEGAMKSAVKAALEEFCRQDAEFAQAVAQGGSFADCMKKVAEGVGNSISDLEVFRRAVGFYFPGATVEFQMTVDVCPNRVRTEEKAETKTEAPMVLDLEAFF